MNLFFSSKIGECLKRLDSIERETGTDVTHRKRKFVKYAEDAVRAFLQNNHPKRFK